MRLADSGSPISSESFTHPVAGSGFAAVNIDTLRNTAIVCGVLIVLALVARTQLTKNRPTPLANLLEWFVDAIQGLINQTLGDRKIPLAPLAITLFVFILFCNMLGLIPGFKSPTNDVNTAIALALMALFFVHFQSVKARGAGGYVSHYFSVVTPSWKNPLGALARIAFGLLEIIQEFAKIFTLSFRLYFNIFVGELMLAIVGLLTLLISAAAGVVGGGWVFFSIFVGIVQAFIFSMLFIAYVGQFTETHHEDVGHTAGAH